MIRASASALLALAACKPAPQPQAKPDPVRAIAAISEELDTLPFAEVIAATTGHRVMPVDEASAFLNVLPPVLDAAIAEFSKPTSPVRGLRRINEASRFFEDYIAAQLDAHPEFSCGYPKTIAGKTQRSGYPDLVITHLATGTVAYLDPKLFEETGRKSSLRTFYYEPKGETSKIREDAHHLLAGIAHDGKDGAWQFTSWDLVDLSKFNVRLKAEFQGSNRDLYRDDLILRSGKAADGD